MKQFTMSMYSSKEELYKAKSEYWELVAMSCIQRLVETGELHEDGDCFYWDDCGESVDECLV